MEEIDVERALRLQQKEKIMSLTLENKAVSQLFQEVTKELERARKTRIKF